MIRELSSYRKTKVSTFGMDLKDSSWVTGENGS